MVRNKKAAFTLVELLVVIAIISILAGLLLPALEEAIESAHQISCSNRQRQASMFLNFYAEDFAGYYPRATGNTYTEPTGFYTLAGYRGPWSLILFLSGYVDFPGDIATDSPYAHTIMFDNGILNCPSLKPHPYGEHAGMTFVQTYGIRCWRWFNYNTQSHDRDYWEYHINVNQDYKKAWSPQSGPSTYPVGGDSIRLGSFGGVDYTCQDGEINYCNYIPHRRHKDRANIWFLDGHVESGDEMKLIDLIQSDGGGDFVINWNDDGFDNSWPRSY